jgi:hypothetical protein
MRPTELKMSLRPIVGLAVAVIGLLMTPRGASAQSWQEYAFPEHAFVVHFPSPPTVTKGVYKTTAGVAAPSTVYSATKDNILYTITVGDFSKASVNDQEVINDAVKAAGRDGEIKLDVDARINRQYGHELSVKGKDGSYSMYAIFFFDHRFYQLIGRSPPSIAERGASQTIRFQQSLQFPGS